jgi:hypothetical protein
MNRKIHRPLVKEPVETANKTHRRGKKTIETTVKTPGNIILSPPLYRVVSYKRADLTKNKGSRTDLLKPQFVEIPIKRTAPNRSQMDFILNWD